MPALHELQRRFGAALLGGDTADVEPFVRGGSLTPAERIGIYRNNTVENFTSTLRAAYPVLLQLMGDEYFRQIAGEFRERHPSTSGNLQHLGAPLAAFLERRLAKTPYAYFADVARLEWAYQEVLVAAEHAPFAIERLATVPEAAWATLRFVLHPAVRLVSAQSPILALWSAHQGDRAMSEPDRLARIDLAVAESVLIHRTREDVEMRVLGGAEFTFLEKLVQGATLAAAAQDAAALDADFDLASNLQRWVALEVIVDFQSGVLS